ncbi:MAG TPA: hypothetical protein PLW61_04730 [Caldisericia bacterium]|nr:hypothetical protein [Caldisericia bacterium]
MEEREPRFEIWSTPRQQNRWNAYFRMLQEQLEDSIQNGMNQQLSTMSIGEALDEASYVPIEISDFALPESQSRWVSYDIEYHWPFKEEKKVPTIIELSPEEEF